MYAVIETGGKQYRVEQGKLIRIEKLAADAGALVQFNRVLLVADGDKIRVGTPIVPNAKVTGEILGEEKGEKLVVFKFKRTRGYRRRTGHRQKYTAVRITEISA